MGGVVSPLVWTAGKVAVRVACVVMRIVIDLDQVEVGGVAEFFAAEFAVADDGELRCVAVFFGHIRLRANHGGGNDGVGMGGELVGDVY